jgi:hypothetical protein
MHIVELSTYSGGKRVVPDRTARDEFRLARGWWEAKDSSDKLAAEIQKKLKAGYPAPNTILEDTQYQVKKESDPNRDDDPDYIVKLAAQVVRISVETVRIVKGLPDYR